MCRIAGIINGHLSTQELNKTVKLMCDTMAHGGPDGEGFFVNTEKGIAFGHRRLAIIDLSPTGAQPMFYDQKRLVITYNGEICNYLELKTTLMAQGFTFKSNSDTEVILAGYSAWGVSSFEKLKGMFAFALYDSQKNLTFLVRDQSGIKPLYYSTQNQGLIFASEIRAFKTLTPQFKENPDWKVYFLAFGHIPEPYTTLSNVSVLPKGKYLTWDHQTNQHTTYSFASRLTGESIHNKAEAEQVIHRQFKKSVERHLLSDAPIGIFLSGGIDSCLIALLANQHAIANTEKGNSPFHTLSVNFDEADYSEKYFQNLVTSKIKGTQSEYTITKPIFDNLFPTALKAMDQPSTDGINSWFINYFANKKGIKAVLSGIGADELFGGYPSFKRMNLVKRLSKLPKFVLKLALNANKPAIKRIYYLRYKNTIGEYLFLRGLFNPKEIAALLDRPIKDVDEVLRNMNINSMPVNLKPEAQASWLETNMYMQNQLLKDTDAMSMQHGVEVRVPFLDQDLIVALSQIDNDIKFKGNKPKSLLVDAFNDLLPNQIWNRPKMGFTFPFQSWLRENQGFLKQLSSNKNKLRFKLANDFKDGKLHWAKAMALYLTTTFEK